ncbi:MAG: hypothetical protein JWL84_738 [Rhodospirillales bacterium]|jgi:hypothetical protein|nr:hypothetical protein [Rhodospirillales bacterium]
MVRTQIGPVKSLLDAVRAEKLLWFFCLFCRHAGRFDPRELAGMTGRNMNFDELRPRLKCRRCKKRGEAEVLVSRHGWPGR